MKDVGGLVAKRLQQLCSERNISYYRLAELSQVSPSTISRIKNGTISPSIQVLQQLCEGLEVSLAEFFDATSQRVIESDVQLLSAYHRMSMEEKGFVRRMVLGKI